MYGPRLRGERISLEPPRREDIQRYLDWFSDPRVTATLLTRFVPSVKQEEEWLESAAASESQVNWRIAVDGETIGGTGIMSIDWVNRQGFTGLFIGDRERWGKGYASEAVALRTRYAFQELGLERLESESLVENIPMHRALEKSGYEKTGRKRRRIWRAGRWHDAFAFELLRDDWLTLHRDE